MKIHHGAFQGLQQVSGKLLLLLLLIETAAVTTVSADAKSNADPAENAVPRQSSAVISEDKALHFIGGFSSSLLSSALGTAVFDPAPAELSCSATLFALSGASLAAAGKEGLDALGFGTCDVMDAVWTVAGGAAGALFAAAAAEASLASGSSPPADRLILTSGILGAVSAIPVLAVLISRLLLPLPSEKPEFLEAGLFSPDHSANVFPVGKRDEQSQKNHEEKN